MVPPRLPPSLRLPGQLVVSAVSLALVLGVAGIEGSLWRAPALALVAVLLLEMRLAATAMDRVSWVMAFDAVAVSLLCVVSNAPVSGYFLLALSGAWWAASIGSPWAPAAYVVLFGAPYVVLGMRDLADPLLVSEVVRNVAALVLVAVLAMWNQRQGQQLTVVAGQLRAGSAVDRHSLRRRLASVLAREPLPADSLLAAAQLGLNVQQTELLACLVLGLTNSQIAEVSTVSEATVKYRLTRLYRCLGVRGRAEAVTLAHSLGLGAIASDSITIPAARDQSAT